MTTARRSVIAIIAVVLSLGPSDPASLAEPAIADLVVIVNADNRDMTTGVRLERIFLRQDVVWATGERIIPLNGSPESERRQRFDRVILRMSPDDVARYWLDQRIRGGVSGPREVGDAALTATLVSKLPGAIAYVPTDVRLDGTRTIARIHNDKVVSP